MRNPLDLWRAAPMLSDMNSLQRSFDRFFNEWPASYREPRDLSGQVWNPSCEVKESKSHYEFKFDLPGVSKDQIKVELHENTLSVSGERKEERKEEDKEKRRHLSETFYGSFSRTFTLPTPVDNERVEAKFENGVLSLSIPKAAPNQARQISIR